MAAGRTSGDRNEIRVTAVVGDVLLDPRQGTLDVHDVVRPGVLRADAVVDRQAHPAALGHMAQQGIGLRPSHTDRPGAAGHLQKHGRLTVPRQVGAAPDVSPVHPAMRTVLHGAGFLDVAPADQVGWPDADPGATAPRGLRLGGDLLVVVAESLTQRLFEVRFRCHIAAVDEVQQRPCDCREHQRDPAPGPAEVATQAAAQRVEHRDAHVHRRHLRRRPAEREHSNGGVTLTGDGLHAVGGVDEFCDRAQQRVATLTHGRP